MSSAEKEFFAQAASEVADGRVDHALFVKALAMSDGDERKARALYVRWRAEEIQAEYKREQRLNTTARVVGGAAGLAVGTAQATAQVARQLPGRAILCALFSLFVPGSGQLISGRQAAAAAFFLPWICLVITTVSAGFFADTLHADRMRANYAIADSAQEQALESRRQRIENECRGTSVPRSSGNAAIDEMNRSLEAERIRQRCAELYRTTPLPRYVANEAPESAEEIALTVAAIVAFFAGVILHIWAAINAFRKFP